MKERPILMTPENAQKVHDGTKTQTRRVIDLSKRPGAKHAGYDPRADESKYARCPYGIVGDRLYLKETHYAYGHWNRTSWPLAETERVRWSFAPHREKGVKFSDNPPVDIETDRTRHGWFKRSPLFMEKIYGRIWMEITEIRVERLKEISGPDCIAEGVRRRSGVNDGVPLEGDIWKQERADFALLWESINGKDSWSLNPWVWCLTFKKVDHE